MTIIRFTEFLRTPLGRISNFLLIIAVLNLNSCTVYKASETNMDEIRAREQIINNLDFYKIFVHDDYNSYALINPVFNADGSLSGDLKLTTYQTPDSTWSKQEKKEYWKNHKYDINIYSNSTLSDLRADLDPSAGIRSGVTITSDMITKMTITSIDGEGVLAGVALALLIVVGVLVLLSLLIVLIAVAVDEGTDSSSDGSGNSGSTSDSGSGASGSGSS